MLDPVTSEETKSDVNSFSYFFLISQLIRHLRKDKRVFLQYILVSPSFPSCLAYLQQVLFHVTPPSPPPQEKPMSEGHGAVKDGGVVVHLKPLLQKHSHLSRPKPPKTGTRPLGRSSEKQPFPFCSDSFRKHSNRRRSNVSVAGGESVRAPPGSSRLLLFLIDISASAGSPRQQNRGGRTSGGVKSPPVCCLLSGDNTIAE